MPDGHGTTGSDLDGLLTPLNPCIASAPPLFSSGHVPSASVFAPVHAFGLFGCNVSAAERNFTQIASKRERLAQKQNRIMLLQAYESGSDTVLKPS